MGMGRDGGTDGSIGAGGTAGRHPVLRAPAGHGAPHDSRTVLQPEAPEHFALSFPPDFQGSYEATRSRAHPPSPWLAKTYFP